MLKITWPYKKIVFKEALLNSLYRYALSLTHDQHFAYDLLQSSCEKVLIRNDKNLISDEQQLKSYMQRIIKNDFIDQYRRNKLELVIDSTVVEDDLEQETSIALENTLIDQQHVSIILEELTPKERELLYLWAVEGNTVQELADRTNTPRGTLLSRLSRIRKRLQLKYSDLNTQATANE